MYRIRLPSGREAEFASIEELALALRRGDVSREALIYHRRSDKWVPIEEHPRFQGGAEEADAAGRSDTSDAGDATDAADVASKVDVGDGLLRADAMPAPGGAARVDLRREEVVPDSPRPAESAPVREPTARPPISAEKVRSAPADTAAAEAVSGDPAPVDVAPADRTPTQPAPDDVAPVAPASVEAESSVPAADAPISKQVPEPEPGPAPVTHEPVAPTPMPPPAPAPMRTHAAPPVAPTPYPVRPPASAPAHAPPPLAPRAIPADATRVAERRDETGAPRRPGLFRRLARLLLVALVGGGAYFAWDRWGGNLLADRGDVAPGFEAAPPPSTLIRGGPADSTAVRAPQPVVRAARPDPRAPITVDELIARHAATVAGSRRQLAAEMETIGFPNVFGPISFASPLGARAARRRIASALNVIGQFHRRSVLLDQAYGDTASFQASRAWSAGDRERWDARPTLREPYASADLAESLLADADSLLAILGNAPQFELREDTVAFGDPVRAAAYDAQRRRFLERIGPPVEDFDRRPTLFLVRRSLDPTRPPAPLP